MDYASNSHKSKEEPKEAPPEKKLEKVAVDEVILREKSLGHKTKAIFFGGDFKEVIGYVTADVILPGLRQLMFNMIVEGSERMILGASNKIAGKKHDPRPRVSYDNPMRRAVPDPRSSRLPDQPPHFRRRNRREASDLVLTSREQAEEILGTLMEVVDKYGVASLADLYELAGLQSSPIDRKWGWTYLTNADIRQVREGWLLEIPPMEEI